MSVEKKVKVAFMAVKFKINYPRLFNKEKKHVTFKTVQYQKIQNE